MMDITPESSKTALSAAKSKVAGNEILFKLQIDFLFSEKNSSHPIKEKAFVLTNAFM